MTKCTYITSRSCSEHPKECTQEASEFAFLKTYEYGYTADIFEADRYHGYLARCKWHRVISPTLEEGEGKMISMDEYVVGTVMEA